MLKMVMSSNLRLEHSLNPSIIAVHKIHWYWKIVDYILLPIMWVLCGCRDLQESHLWHIQRFDCPFIQDSAGVTIVGDETSWAQERHLALFHMPIFGGWKKYITLEVQKFDNYWHVGWKVKYFDVKRREKCEIQKLKIFNNQIRVLVGQKDSTKMFFGLNSSGEIIPVKKVGKGVLGDNKFPKTRLF